MSRELRGESGDSFDISLSEAVISLSDVNNFLGFNVLLIDYAAVYTELLR